MAIIIILAFTMLFMWGTAALNYGGSAAENGKYVLGITIPAQYRQEAEVRGIAEDYRREERKINLLGLAACVPVLLMNGYLSFAILFLLLWYGLLIYFHQENVKRSARRLYRVKCALYAAARKARPQVFCSDTGVNQKLDRLARRESTGCMVFHSWVTAILALCMGCTAAQNDVTAGGLGAGSAGALALLLLLGAAGSLSAFYFSWNRIKREREKVLEALSETGEQVYGDEDEYWLNGYPEGISPTGLTERRIGPGWTAAASLKGTAADKTVLILTGVFVLGLCLFLMPYDFAQVKLEIADGRCRVSAAYEACGFAAEDVEQVVLMKERPSMSKKSGYNSNRLFLGDFRVRGYGTCKVFLSLKNEMVIRVDLKDGTLWLNSEDPEVTEEYFRELRLLANQ